MSRLCINVVSRSPQHRLASVASLSGEEAEVNGRGMKMRVALWFQDNS